MVEYKTLAALNISLASLVTYLNISNLHLISTMYSNPYLFSLYFFSNFFINLFAKFADYYSTKKVLKNPEFEEANFLFREKNGNFRHKRALIANLLVSAITAPVPYLGIANSIHSYLAAYLNHKNSKKTLKDILSENVSK